MQLHAIEKVSGLSREQFSNDYLTPMKPVVFKDLMDDWAAKDKWTIEHFKSKYGDLMVPVYSNNYSKPGKGYMAPEKKMKFGEFLDILTKPEPCDLRMFLFNIFQHAKELTKDYQTPTIMDGFYNDFPFMFFGGKGSKVALHYDIDMSHVFLNQIHGRKRVVLFSPDQSKLIYHLPYTVASYIDVNHPDYQKHPAQRFAVGNEVMLYPGETLFIPSGYWHYIEYTDGGFSISLRSNESITRRIKGAINIAKHFMVDKGMNKIMGEEWLTMKNNLAQRRAQEAMSVHG